MMTPSYNLSATERVLPKLALDFTTASLDTRITFTRTTDATHPATYTNSSGYVATATNNSPRFDYDPVSFQCMGLLIEESRSNLLTYSQELSTGWTKVLTLVEANAAVSPDGTNNAVKLKATSSTLGNHQDYQIGKTITNGSAYTASCYFKAAEYSTGILNLYDTVAGNIYTFFNLANGTVGTVGAGCTATIKNIGNGWYRCSVTRTVSSTSGGLSIEYSNADNVISFSATANYGVYAWGAQLEAGAFATSYIPTTTAALTRNADVAVMTGTNFSNWFNAGNGAFGCSVLPKSASGVKPVLQCDDATALNTIVMQGNATTAEMKITTLAVLQNTLSTGTIIANAQYGLCGAWSAGSDALSKSGASPATGAPLTIPTVTQARLGSDGTNYFNGWLKKINYWPMRVTNSETQAFSK